MIVVRRRRWYEETWNPHMARHKYWGKEYAERARRGEIHVNDKYHRLARQHVARQPSTSIA
jgi:hypothetical protein